MSTAMVSLVLAVVVLPSATSAAVATARRDCSNTCGIVDIPYPFGLGPSCSLPGFSLTCAGMGNTNYPLLGNLPIRYLSAEVNNLYASIFYTVKMIPGVDDYSVHWEAPARNFAISGSSNMFFAVGCGFEATLFAGNSTVEVGSCFVSCFEARFMEKMPEGRCDDSIGCCFIHIQVNLRAFSLNISRVGNSAYSNKVYAFISGDKDQIFRPIDALGSEAGVGAVRTPANPPYLSPVCGRKYVRTAP